MPSLLSIYTKAPDILYVSRACNIQKFRESLDTAPKHRLSTCSAMLRTSTFSVLCPKVISDITDFYLIRRLCLLSVDQNAVVVTCFVCDGSALNQAGNLQIFVQSHAFTFSFNCFDGRNTGILAAGMSTSRWSIGKCPFLAARWRSSITPNPAMVTFSSCASASAMRQTQQP